MKFHFMNMTTLVTWQMLACFHWLIFDKYNSISLSHFGYEVSFHQHQSIMKCKFVQCICVSVCVHVMCMQINRKPYSDDSMCRLISTFWFWYDIGWPARRLLLKQHCSSNICNMVKSILIQRMILIFNYDFFFTLFPTKIWFSFWKSIFCIPLCFTLYTRHVSKKHIPNAFIPIR